MERLVFDALRLSGDLPLVSEKDIARLEAEFGKHPTLLPESLKDALALLRSRSIQSTTNLLRLSPQSGSQENLARAAREGGDIAADTEQQMQRDREVAERDLDSET